MTTQPIYLVDRSLRRIAVLNVALMGECYRGTICLDATPMELKHLFEEYEENVEGQMFSLADEIEERIGSIPLKVVFPNGMEACVKDLQVYPSTNRVSFKICQATTTAS